MMMSQRMMSGRTSCAFSTASRPLPTVVTSKSSSENVSSMTFWIVMLSSANRIFLPIAVNLRQKIDRRCPYVNREPAFAPPNRAGSTGPGALPGQPHHVLQGGARQEDLRDADLLQLGDVLGRDDPPHEDLGPRK